MKQLLFIVCAIAIVLGTVGTVSAVPINADFSDYPGAPAPPIGQVDLDTAAANSWFDVNYGITFQNVYLYYDDRDSFDAMGIANDAGSPSTGWVMFSDTTDFVTIDWTTINSNSINVDIYDATNTLLDSFFHSGTGTQSGTTTLNGTAIASMSFHNGGGQVGISTLMYDYDGTTDGRNDDVAVPEPGTMLLLGTGLIGLAYSRRKLNK